MAVNLDFQDSAEDLEYRLRARAWIAANGRDITLTGLAGRSDDPRDLAAAKQWQRRKAEAGYACIAWPVAWGGAGGTPIQEIIFAEEEKAAGLHTRYFASGLGMCVPAIFQFCAPDISSRFGAAAVRGDALWCQLFSEPSAGSDLAAAQTFASRVEGGWRVSGQKVWTTGAHYADWGLLVARTDRDLPRHRGLSVFWVDMNAEGVERRPIRQMNDGREFNEVFLTDVRLDGEQLVGELHRGWDVIIATLMRERVDIGAIAGPSVGAMVNFSASLEPPALGARERLAKWCVLELGLQFTRYRTLTKIARGDTPGAESAIGKLVAANLMQEMGNFALEAQGPLGLVVSETNTAATPFRQALMWSPGLRVGGGTDEILKNIIAERVLGLPKS